MRIDDRRQLQAIDGLLSYPTTLGQPLIPDLRQGCFRLLTAIAARWKARQAAEELASLSDRMLADIGLTRWDLAPTQRRRPLVGMH